MRPDVEIGGEVDANRTCTVDSLVKEGDEWDLYRVTHDGRPGLLKIACSDVGDDLVLNEAFTLTSVRSASAERFHPYLPVLFDVFDHEGRQCIVIEWMDGFYTLREVMEAYPNGIDLKDMAWMMRRILVGVGVLHRADYIHGAILPPNILIHPEMHGLVMTNLSYAVPADGLLAKEPITPDPAYIDWYPDSPRMGVPPSRALDTALAARTMVAVCGGDVQSLTIPDASQEFRGFFQACFGPRVPDAWSLKVAFDALIEDMWGRRRFHEFHMPPKVTA